MILPLSMEGKKISPDDFMGARPATSQFLKV